MTGLASVLWGAAGVFTTFPHSHLNKVGKWAILRVMGRMDVLTKKADSKGRITLGESFANRIVLMETRGDEVVLRLARVIPEGEAWLYENEKALASVRRGLKQAEAREFAKKGPDLADAAKLAAQLQDD